MTACKLSVNINKIATLRNARGGNIPNVVKAALDIERYGGEGITVHPRPDERHIRYRDVYELKECVTTEFNIEGYPSEDFLKLVMLVKPHQVTLVPDSPEVLTSNAGWDAIREQAFLKKIVDELKQKGMRVSLFMDTDIKQINAAYQKAATHAATLNIGVNAGHDLNLHNLNYLIKNIPQIVEVSIGHALISDALYFGLQNTVQMYKHQIKSAR